MSPQTQKIQALLFVAGEAVSKKELAELIKEPVEQVEAYLQELEEALAGHGIVVIVTSTHAQLATAPALGEYLAQFQQEQLGKLTKAASETLSIIAYKGPISRFDIDALRGVDSRSMIRQLTRRGIVAQVQQSGRTPLYDVTEDFFAHIGIAKRKELPDFETLSNDATLQRILHSEDDQKST